MENNQFGFSYNITNKTNNFVNIPSSVFQNQVSNYGVPSVLQTFPDQGISNSYTYNPHPSNLSDVSVAPPVNQMQADTSSEDQLWIESWLSQLGKKEERPSKNSVKVKSMPKIQIYVAKSSLQNCLVIIEKLQTMQEELKENAETMSSADWKKKTLEIGMLKDQFSKFVSHFENPEVITQLKARVNKRKKKRLNQKRKKVEARENRIQEEEERQRLHKKIDQWLENKREEVERIKADEIMKKDADCILAEVTKKKSDARKQLSLISALVKLRSVRENVAIQQGKKISVEDRQAFTKTTDQLMKMWEDSLKVYSKEEQGLRIMLEQNAAEDNNAAQLAKERKITQEWETVLFGPKVIPSQLYWGLTCADKDLETFIAIRKSWDTFLAKPDDPEGSRIPIGWVLPDENALDSWKKYLQHP